MRSCRLLGLLGSLLFLLLGGSSASAGGNAEEGKAKSLACQACHISSSASAAAPRLVGQREAYIAKQLRAFKAGDRKDAQMSVIAKQLSDADIENLAAYWSSQPAGSDAEPTAATAGIRLAAKLAVPKDFPKGFTVYHAALDEKAGTVSRSYANAAAMAAVRGKKPLGDGSAIIVVNYSAKLDAAKKPVMEADGSPAVDKVKSYSVMEARAGWGKDIPDLLRNDNWAYGVFTADKTPRTEVNQAMCLACHKDKAAESYMFSLKELQAKVLGKEHAAAPKAGASK
jgi:cytochrome c553